MLYRRFGKTEIQMPVFSTGGMRYQQGWKDVDFSEIEKKNQENLEATIHKSIEVGINHIETARGYGTSEMQLGKVLPTFNRSDLIVQTKVGVKDSGAEFLESFETSMAYLKLDHVDLLSVHGINNNELLKKTVKPGGCLEMARKLQKQGRVKHIGFSTHGSCKCICNAIATEAYGGFDYVNLHYYYINQSNWPAVQAAKAKDMGVFIISPNDKGGLLYKPTDVFKDACGDLHPMTFNTRFCLLKDEVHTLSLGASCPEDYDLHIEGIKSWDGEGDEVATIIKNLGDLMERKTGVKHPYKLSSRLPEWEDVPGEMNLQIMLWLWHMAKGWDMFDYGKLRYNLLGNAEHWFPGKHAKALVDGEISTQEIIQSVRGSGCEDWIIQRLGEVHEMLIAQEVKRQSES